MRKIAVAPMIALALCAGLAACSSSPPPPPATSNQAGPPVLNGWKLTIPEANSKGNAASVDPAQPTPPWLTVGPTGELVFWTPVNGATTKNSDHTRTELNNLTNFKAGTAAQEMRATVAVDQVPTQDRRVIIGQIHGADDISSVPFVMLFYAEGTVRVVVKQRQSGTELLNYPLLPDVPLGAKFDYGIKDDGNGTLTFTAGYNGQKETVDAPLPAAFAGATVRFQAGAYQQDISAGLAPADDGAKVTFYSLAAGPVR